MSRVLESTDWAVRRAKHVSIDEDNLCAFCSSLDHAKFVHWLDRCPFAVRHIHTSFRVPFVFVLDSISFCYWGFPKWQILYRGQSINGAWGLVACLGQAVLNGVPLCDPNYLSRMNEREFRSITDGNTAIPLAKERVAI